MADESPELFDDIYLGLRAGGAARKQRRGEPLSADEEEAIGRWQRLSLWRRFVAIGEIHRLGAGAGVATEHLDKLRVRYRQEVVRSGQPDHPGKLAWMHPQAFQEVRVGAQ